MSLKLAFLLVCNCCPLCSSEREGPQGEVGGLGPLNSQLVSPGKYKMPSCARNLQIERE